MKPSALTSWSIVLSIVMIVCGFLAITLPIAASLGVIIVISWLLIISGLIQFFHAFAFTGIGPVLWRVGVAVLYFVTGLYFLVNPGVGLATLTLFLGGFFIAEGVFDAIAYFAMPTIGRSRWLLADGVISTILGIMIWAQWPSSSLWAVGTLVGVNMIMTGSTRLMLTLAVRRAAKGLIKAVA